MAKSNQDNYTRPEDKARWGFGGTAKEIKVAPQTVGETPEQGGLESDATGDKEATEARKNGGGAKASK